ncbi:MAG: hypothetical protein V1737_01565 [Chloroflexota bacterium]
MSRLVEKLHLLTIPSQAIGFRSSGTSQAPSLLMLAAFGKVAEASKALVSGVDGIVVPAQELLIASASKLKEAAGDVPIGAGLGPGDSSDSEKVATLISGGCDFIFFDATTSLEFFSSAASAEELGRFITIDSQFPASLIPTLDDLPVDGVVIQATKAGVDISYLLLCQLVCRLVDRPLIASVPVTDQGAELRYLWDAGIDAVVTTLDSADRLKQLREVSKSLGKAKRHETKKTPIVPHLAGEVYADEEEE